MDDFFFCSSFGLVGAPRVRFLRKNLPRANGEVEAAEENGEEENFTTPSTSRDVFSKFRSKTNTDADTAESFIRFAEASTSAPIKFDTGLDDDADEDLLVVKKYDVFNVADEKVNRYTKFYARISSYFVSG